MPFVLFFSVQVFPEEMLNDLNALEQLRDALVSAEPIRPQLDRSMSVLLPAEAAAHVELPSEFFSMTADELKKEMQTRQVIIKETAIVGFRSRKFLLKIKCLTISNVNCKSLKYIF